MILHFTTSKIWKLESDFRLESKRVELLIIWVLCDMIAIYNTFTICCVFAFNRVGVYAGAGDDEKTSPNLAGPFAPPMVNREWMHSRTKKRRLP